MRISSKSLAYLCCLPVFAGIVLCVAGLLRGSDMPLWVAVCIFGPLLLLLAGVLALFLVPLFVEDWRRFHQ